MKEIPPWVSAICSGNEKIRTTKGRHKNQPQVRWTGDKNVEFLTISINIQGTIEKNQIQDLCGRSLKKSCFCLTK